MIIIGQYSNKNNNWRPIEPIGPHRKKIFNVVHFIKKTYDIYIYNKHIIM